MTDAPEATPCPTCAALVRPSDMGDHKRWHDGEGTRSADAARSAETQRNIKVGGGGVDF